MVGEINIILVFVLLVLTALLAIFVTKTNIKLFEKIGLYFFLLGFFFYSGVGIALPEVSKEYILQYFLFAAFFCFAFFIAIKIVKRIYVKPRKIVFQKGIGKACTYLFWIMMLIKLIYPNNRLPYLLHPTVSLVGVFSEDAGVPFIIYIINILLLLIRPIYYVDIYKRCSVKKMAFLLLAEVYLTVVINSYIARSGLISQVIFVVLAILSRVKVELDSFFDEQKHIFRRIMKTLAIMFLAVIILLPMLYEFQFYRLGAKASASLSAGAKVSNLLETEFGFPLHFEFCEEMYDGTYFIRYIVYVITLAIPKQLVGMDRPLLLNQEFSTLRTGIEYGASGFSVLLPGILGEGIIMFGKNCAFLFGGVLGLIIGLIYSLYSRYKEFNLWTIYMAINILLMCRGGSQGAISIMINGSVLIFLSSFFDKYTFTIRRN